MKNVLRQTGLKPDTLRAWEKRYQAVVPSRLKNGRRAYSESEVTRLKILCDLVASGQSIGTIAHLSNQELVKLSSANQKQNVSPLSKIETEHISSLIQALEKFNMTQLKIELSKVRYLISPQDFTFKLIPQLMFLVGEKISKNELSFSQEHALTDLIKNHILEIHESISPLDGTKLPLERLLFTTREGDIHELGILLIALFCRFKGFSTQYLGTNLPAQSLCEAVKKLKSSTVVISLSYLLPVDEKISSQKYLEQLNELLPIKTGIWCGGSAVREVNRPKSQREILIFESLSALEEKLRIRK